MSFCVRHVAWVKPTIFIRRLVLPFCEGTFLTAPIVFYQFYTIHTSVEGCFNFFLYTLLLDKKESIYCHFLSVLRVESPKRITIDFEVVVRSSIIATHQVAQIRFFLYESKRLAIWLNIRQYLQLQP